MKRLVAAIFLSVPLACMAATTVYNQFGTYSTPSTPAKPYCNSAFPTVIVGAYIPAGSSTIDTSVANTTKITEYDSSGGRYLTTITTAASGVGSVLTAPACAVH